MNRVTIEIITWTMTFVAVLAFSMLLAYPYMILWNQCLVPAIPGLREVEWLQMWAIAILFNGLFKGFK
jgi:hypothetical protein